MIMIAYRLVWKILERAKINARLISAGKEKRKAKDRAPTTRNVRRMDAIGRVILIHLEKRNVANPTMNPVRPIVNVQVVAVERKRS